MAILPANKTKLFLSVLVFGTGTVFRVLDFIDASQWVTIALTVLGMYAASKVSTDYVRGKNGNS